MSGFSWVLYFVLILCVSCITGVVIVCCTETDTPCALITETD